MSPKLPILKTKEVIRFLEGQGFYRASQKGSHAKYRHEDGRTTIVPVHTGEDIGPGLLLKILNDAGIDPNLLRQ